MLIRSATCLFLLLSFCFAGHGNADEKASEQIESLPVGEKAINFELPIIGQDDYIELQDEYKQGPVVVIVLRGFPGAQCPLCKQQVSALVNRARALEDKVHKVILVYPGETEDLMRRAKQFVGSRRIPAPLVIVADPGMRMVKSWGLRWDKPHETAYPATYLIKANGRVAWRKISDSHAGRTSVEEILGELKKL
ncbi:MAG: redoxin domain-containing protein [Pirellulaceae bacterium]